MLSDKIMKTSLLELLGFLIVLLIRPLTVQAAVPLTSAFTRIDQNPITYSSGGNFIGGTDDFSGGTPDSSSYAGIRSIEANYANNGVLTNRTTQIVVRFDSVPIAFSEGATISSFRLDIFNGSQANQNAIPVSLLSPGKAMVDLGNSDTTSITLDSYHAVFNVDLSHLGTDFPIYLGYELTATSDGNYAGTAAYQLAQFTPPILRSKPTITGTMPDSTSQAVAVSADDQRVTGTGVYPGDTILIQQNGTTVGTAKVTSDKKYTVDLKQKLGAVNNIQVTEINDVDDGTGGYTGATSSSTATVEVPTVTLNRGHAVTFAPAQLDTLTTDADAVNWLVHQAGLVGTTSASGTVTYQTQTSALLTTLRSLANNVPTTINIRATSGDRHSDYVPVTVTKTAGQLSFGSTFPAVSFGRHAIPAIEERYAPATAIQVPITDTRAQGSNWTLMASASVLTGTDGRFNGNLEYQDANGSVQTLTGSSVQVATGRRQAAQTTVNATAGWTDTGTWHANDQGIFLDALPGTTAGQYHGVIQWTLSDTPSE